MCGPGHNGRISKYHEARVAEFEKKIKEHEENLSVGRPPACPHHGCACQVSPRGYAVRNPKIEGGIRIGPVRIRLWRCPEHKRFRELPPWLLRFKHYVSEVVDSALQSRADGVPLETFCEAYGLPDVRTPSRWVASFVARLKEIGLQVERRLWALRPAEARGSPLESRWQYAYVWQSLGRLEDICRAQGHPLSRPHFIFSL